MPRRYNRAASQRRRSDAPQARRPAAARTPRRCARSCTGSARRRRTSTRSAARRSSSRSAARSSPTTRSSASSTTSTCCTASASGSSSCTAAGRRSRRSSQQQSIPSRYAHGVRVTDADAMDCVLEAAGQVRARIEALLSLGLANSPMAGARNRVSSGNYLTAKPMGVVDGVDMQLTGEVRRVDTEAIQQRLDDGDIVLISPIGYSPTGEIFNLTVEEVATQVAVRLQATKLIFLMDADGVRNGRRQLLTDLSTTRRRGAARASASKLAPDVRLYLPAAVRACDNGVKRAHLISRQHRRRAAARAVHARRRRHDGRVDRARAPAQRDDRRRRRHPGDHRAARGAGRARAPLARAAGERDRALRRRRVRQPHHRLRGAVRVSRTSRSASSPRSPCIPISAAKATARR